MSDRDLVKRILAGDHEAFSDLMDTYKHLVAHMVARVINDDRDREEICQDVFIKVYDSLHGFKFDSRLSTWIATIAYRMAINKLRKQQKWQSEVDLDGIAFRVGEVDHSVEDADYSLFLRGLIDQMPVHYKTVLSLYYLDGFSYPEIVAITDMPEGTVKNYIFRAKKKLRALMTPYLGKEILK